MPTNGSRRAAPRRTPGQPDHEPVAMSAVWKALEPLDKEQRRRVLEWAVARGLELPDYRIRDGDDPLDLSKIRDRLIDALRG